MTGKQRSTFQALSVATISLGTIVLLGGCRTSQTKQVADATASPSAPSTIALTPPNPNTLPVPGTPILQNSQLPTIPIRGLTPATEPSNLAAKAQQRPSQVDPFANSGPTFYSIPFAKPATKTADPKAVKATAKPQNRLAVVNPANRSAVNSPPRSFGPAPNMSRRTAALPSFPQLRSPQPMRPSVRDQRSVIAVPQLPATRVAALPANSLPQTIAPVRPSLAEGIAITGVLQTNGNTVVIAKSPNEQSARYVKAGDSIGSVRVKSIQVSRSGEPTVILEQNGVEVTKSIGPGR
jgi:hypothetical protein